MTRGARAVHGDQVTASVHGHAGQTFEVTALIPSSPYIAVNCWCDCNVVAVPHPVFRHEGRTLSCGGPTCVAPDGDMTAGYLLPASPPENIEAWLARSGHAATSKRPARRVVFTRRRMIDDQRWDREATAIRRDLVVLHWRRGLGQQAIAVELDVPDYIVRNDLALLRKKGQLQ